MSILDELIEENYSKSSAGGDCLEFDPESFADKLVEKLKEKIQEKINESNGILSMGLKDVFIDLAYTKLKE